MSDLVTAIVVAADKCADDRDRYKADADRLAEALRRHWLERCDAWDYKDDNAALRLHAAAKNEIEEERG